MRPRGDILADYRSILSRINAPAAFFGRVRRLNRQLDLSGHRLRRPFGNTGRDLRTFARITWQLGVRDRDVRREFWRTLADSLFHRPRTLRGAMSFAALYLHVKSFSRFMDELLLAQLETLVAPVPAWPAAAPKVVRARA